MQCRCVASVGVWPVYVCGQCNPQIFKLNFEQFASPNKTMVDMHMHCRVQYTYMQYT